MVEEEAYPLSDMNTQEDAEHEFALSDDGDLFGFSGEDKGEENVEVGNKGKGLENLEVGKDKGGEPEKTKHPLPFLSQVPRKKMPWVRGEETEEWVKSGNNYATISNKLRGSIGRKAVFMPTPGHQPFAPPRGTTRGTPPASTPPGSAPSQQSNNSQSTRRSSRLQMKDKFKFNNTRMIP